jgi:hypothetical protein
VTILLPTKTRDESAKYCSTCLKFNIYTPVERYHDRQLELCTYHYWMIRGKVGGQYTLKTYAEASRHNAIGTSLPSPEEIARMNGD